MTLPGRLGQGIKRVVARYGQETSRNERLIYQEVSFQAVVEAGAMSFMAVFLVRLGAPNWLVGMYTSLPALVAIFVALPVGAFVQAKNSLVATTNWARLIFRSTIGLFALLPFLPPMVAPYVLVGARTALEVPAEATNVAFTTILGQVTPPRTRPRMLSTRLAINGLVAAVVGFSAGQWLDLAPYPINYQVLFLSAFVAGLCSIATLSRMSIPPLARSSGTTQGAASVRELPKLIRHAPAFRDFAIAAFIFRLSLSMPQALYPIYRVRTLGASDAWIGTLLTVERVLAVFSYFALSRLLAKPRIRKWLWLGCPGAALYPFAMALARTPEGLLASVICGGIFGSAMNVYLSDMLFACSPENERPTFVAANACLASVAAFVAPMVGTTLADVTNINLALMIGAGMRAVAGLSFVIMRVGQRELTGGGVQSASPPMA